jgi:hypothetical protein
MLSPDLIRFGGGPFLPHAASPVQSHAIPCLAVRLACSAVAGFPSRVLVPDLVLANFWSGKLERAGRCQSYNRQQQAQKASYLEVGR